MAAGLGTRLRPFTERMPKALMPVLGVPMAQFAVDALVAAGIHKIIANVHHHAEAARAGFVGLDLGGARLAISDESAELLGSAGGLRHAATHFGGRPFLLLNADVLSGADLPALIRRHTELRARFGVSLTLCVHPRCPAAGEYREIVFNDAGLMTALGDFRRSSAFFVGSAIVEPEALAHVPAQGPAEFIPTILQPALAARKVGVALTTGTWRDVGSPALWLEAHTALMEGLETGRLDGQRFPDAWRKRIERASARVAPGIWRARGARVPARAAEWAEPAYWGGGGAAPGVLGPSAVLYGPPASATLAGGIGLGGDWVTV